MQLYPAIDIKAGRCVRLLQGRANQETVYGDDPAAMALRWKAAGATYLHVVDLDGAFSGNPQNVDGIKRILKKVDIPLQLGGGIRTMEDIDRWLTAGITRVIIGTAAVKNPTLVGIAVDKYGPEKIMVGIDARDGLVAVDGWESGSAETAVRVALTMKKAGVTHVVYTDIARDGMMTGPNVEATRSLAIESGLSVIASGGVSSMDDLAAVSAMVNDGIDGAIIGKAIYEGVIDLSEAIARFQAAT